MADGVTYIICAAGDGTRTKIINPRVPKPLLKINGQSLLHRSLSSLELYSKDQVIIVGRREHALHRCRDSLINAFPGVSFDWLELEERTRGQLHTAYLSRHLWRKDFPVAIFNADTYFRCPNLTLLQKDENIQGIIPCSEELGDAWSFCKTGEEIYNGESMAVEVAEKRRISRWCSVGYYFFRDPSAIIEGAEEALCAKNEVEAYVAPIYNRLIGAGHRVVVPSTETFLPMGSVEQLETYWRQQLPQLRDQNRLGTIVVDLDNTLTVDGSSTDYREKSPQNAVIERLRQYHEDGWEIVIQTARRMRTMERDEGKVVADVAYETIEWLRKHQIPFSGLKFGKPYANGGFYVDDKAVRPTEFIEYGPEQLHLLLEEEAKKLSRLEGLTR